MQCKLAWFLLRTKPIYTDFNGVNEYSCGHISGPHEPISTKFELWGFSSCSTEIWYSKCCNAKKLCDVITSVLYDPSSWIYISNPISSFWLKNMTTWHNANSMARTRELYQFQYMARSFVIVDMGNNHLISNQQPEKSMFGTFTSASTPQIYTRDPRPLIPPRVMASSTMGLNLGVLGFFADHPCKNKCKTNAFIIFACWAAFLHLFVFTLRPWHMQVAHASDEPWLFWLQEPEDPQI